MCYNEDILSRRKGALMYASPWSERGRLLAEEVARIVLSWASATLLVWGAWALARGAWRVYASTHVGQWFIHKQPVLAAKAEVLAAIASPWQTFAWLSAKMLAASLVVALVLQLSGLLGLLYGRWSRFVRTPVWATALAWWRLDDAAEVLGITDVSLAFGFAFLAALALIPSAMITASALEVSILSLLLALREKLSGTWHRMR